MYFVRHAEPVFAWEDDRTRPLTEEGMKDTEQVLQFFQPLSVDCFYSSPYRRSMQTIESTARFFDKEIITDERLREREKGADGNHHGMFKKRWADLDFHEPGGESIHSVQRRGVDAVFDILEKNAGQTIVIGTHGTALSSILHYFDPSFTCDSFLRIIDWMPYIIELDFVGKRRTGIAEHLHLQKEFKGSSRADRYAAAPIP